MELLRALLEVNAQEIESLRARKEQIKSDLSKFGVGVGQGAVPPQYQDRHRRLKAALQAVNQQLAAVHQRTSAEDGERQFYGSLSQQRAQITPEKRSELHGMAVKDGFSRWYKLRQQFGDDRGIEDAIIKKADELSVNKQELINVDQLAQTFGVPTRTMYKWLERPRLAPLRRLMPHEQ